MRRRHIRWFAILLSLLPLALLAKGRTGADRAVPQQADPPLPRPFDAPRIKRPRDGWPTRGVGNSCLRSSTDSPPARLWDVTAGQKKPAHKAHAWAVREITFAADGRTLATAGDDRMFRLWSLPSGKALFQWGRQPGSDVDEYFPCLALGFIVEGQRLVFARSPLELASRDCRTGQDLTALLSFRESLCSFALAPDRTALAIRSVDRERGKVYLRLHSLPSKRLSWRNREPCDGSPMFPTTQGLQFSPDGRMLASTDCSRAVYLWDTASGKLLRQLKGHKAAVLAVAFSPDGRVLVTCSGGTIPHSKFDPLDDSIRFWDVATGKQLHVMESKHGVVTSVAWSRDGRLVTSASAGGPLQVWEVASGKEVSRFEDKGTWPCVIAFAPTDGRLAAGMSDGTVLLWNPTPPAYHVLRRPLRRSESASLWSDLAATDAAKGYAAVLMLTGHAGEALALLARQLHPTPAVQPEAIRRLIGELDDDHFSRREQASRTLACLNSQAEPELRRAGQDPKTSVEARARIAPLLKAAGEWVVSDPETLRTVRAVWVLERIGTKEARQLLRRLATGGHAARQTQEAKASLQRLQRRGLPK